MDTYYNRNYKTIGNAWKNEIRYYYRTGYNYGGTDYYRADLPKLFDRFVQETKDEKRISESIFVSDVSMVYIQEPDEYNTEWIVRGTQYIRYTSGTKLPKDVELNKWYKLDIDVKFANSIDDIPWEATEFPVASKRPISPYEGVKK